MFNFYVYWCSLLIVLATHIEILDAFSISANNNDHHLRTNCINHAIKQRWDYGNNRKRYHFYLCQQVFRKPLSSLQLNSQDVAPACIASLNYPIGNLYSQPENKSFHGNSMMHSKLFYKTRNKQIPSRQISVALSALQIPIDQVTNKPILFSVIVVLIHIIGGLLGAPIVAKTTKINGGWYNLISLPKWTPSKSIFPYVWTFLYGCMGISVSRIILSSPSNISSLLYVWISHYILNILWAPIFFGQRKLRLGLGINYMLLVTLAIGIIRPFYKVNKISAILLIPYLIWLMCATVLNETICSLNPTINGYNNAKFYYDLDVLQQKAYEYAFGKERKGRISEH